MTGRASGAGGRRNTLLGAVLLVVAVCALVWFLEEGLRDAVPEEPGSRPLPAVVTPSVDAGEVVETPTLPAPAPALAPEPLAPEQVPAETTEDRVDPPELAVAGRVVDGEGAPIAGAVVHLVPSRPTLERLGLVQRVRAGTAWDALPSERTDTAGRFRVTSPELRVLAPPEGRVAAWQLDLREPALVVHAPGFQVVARALRVEADGALELEDIALEPGVRLVGRVVDPTGLPRPGVRASIEDPSPVASGGVAPWPLTRGRLDVLTDPDGAFALDGLWPGRVQLVLSHPETETLTLTVTAEVAGTTELGVFVLEAGHRLHGQVLGPDGQPLYGAAVVVRTAVAAAELLAEHGDGDTIHRDAVLQASTDDVVTRTDDDGLFHVDGLGAGEHEVLVHRAGYEPARRRGVRPADPALSFMLQPAGLLVIRVRDAGTDQLVAGSAYFQRHPDSGSTGRGGPRDEATPSALRVMAGSEAARALGRSDGALPVGLFVAGPAGSVRNSVQVRAEGYALVVLDLPGVPPGGRHEQTVLLEPSASVSGTVRGPEGQPIGDARVMLEHPMKASPHRAVRTDASGAWQIDDVNPGTWRVTAHQNVWLDDDPRDVVVETGSVLTDVDFVLRQGGALAGRVTDAAGQPVRGQVSVTHGRGQSRGGQLQKNGRYRINGLVPGEVQVYVAGKASAVAWIRAGETTRLDIQLPEPASVGGVVRDATGTPVATNVFLVHLGIPIHKTTSGADGGFQFDDVRAGAFFVVARTPVSLAPPVEVQVVPGRHANVQLQFASGVVRGRVVEAGSERPVLGLPLSVRLGVRVGDRWLSDSLRWFTTRTDLDGRFSFEGLPPVTVDLNTSPDRPLKGETSLTVGRDTQHDVTLELAP